MTISEGAAEKCVELGIDPASIEERYYAGKDRTVHEYRSGEVCQYDGRPIYYLVRETSHGDGNHLQWVATEEVWEQIREAR
jgi:hypothetical protein